MTSIFYQVYILTLKKLLPYFASYRSKRILKTIPFCQFEADTNRRIAIYMKSNLMIFV